MALTTLTGLAGQYDWPALIASAADTVYRAAIQTPLQPATRLSQALGVRVLLKREDLQPVFSFKLRGALNRLAQLTDADKQRGVICSSAGNHAQGVAMAAQLLGLRALVVMPATTPQIKVDAVKALGADIRLIGDSYDDAQADALVVAQRDGLHFVHPFDDPYVIAGQATIGSELLTQCAQAPTAVFIPVGGGGLAAGIALAVRAKWPDTQLIGVEHEHSASMQAAFRAQAPVTLPRVGLFADGVAVKRVGDLTYDIACNALDALMRVTTDQICAATRDIYEDTRVVVEPAGAIAVAAARQWSAQQKNLDSNAELIAINCGANLNFDRLRHIAERAAIGEQREALFAITIQESPGSFKQFLDALGPVSVTEFNYRLSDDADARLFVGVELRADQPSRGQLSERLRQGGYACEDISDSELAKLHLRHLVAGGASNVTHERLFRFEFPERPGALKDFLDAMDTDWNITLFHYRNHGSDHGRVLVGIVVPQNH
ncbi:MAG: threonine ammonia-lyase, biosynthetic, partial [Pseudomonadota bacterium]